MEAISEPGNENYEEMRDWYGSDFDPDFFEIGQLNKIIMEDYDDPLDLLDDDGDGIVEMSLLEEEDKPRIPGTPYLISKESRGHHTFIKCKI